MKIISSDEPAKLESQFVTTFFAILESFQNQDHITIGLSGGTSLISFYTAMQTQFSSIQVELREKIRFVFLDERLVPLDHVDSNYRVVSDTFFNPLLEKHLILKEQIIVVSMTITDPEVDYSRRVPTIDIGLFGVGPDGHIASLFPNHPGLQNEAEWYILVHNSPKPPANRISVSVRSIKKIPVLFVFFIGAGKREAYERSLDSNVLREQCPAKYALEQKGCIVVTNLVKAVV